MINNIAIYTSNNANEHNRKTVELYEFLADLSPIPVALNPNIKTLQNAHVFVIDYRREFIDLDDSNKLIFLCRGPLANKHWLLIPSVDVIVANTYYEGLCLSWQLQSKGFKKKVVHLLPWVAPIKLEGDSIYSMALEPRYKNAFWGRELQNTDPRAPVHVCLSESDRSWPYSIVEGMLGGAIPIVTDRPPYNELIIHGHNGFLVNTPEDIIDALQKIDDNRYWLEHNARDTIRYKLDPTRYLSTLINLESLPNIQLKPAPVEYSKRRWLVRERTFKDGQLKYFPENYDAEMTLIDLNEIQEILSYFLTQRFSEVYIFGCEIPEELEKREMIQIMRMIKKIGPSSMKVHFCRDEPIPPIWEKVFARLSIISVEEGLKQVLN